MKHLDNHNILSSCQHGFRRNHSCETQLILTSQDIARAYTHKKQMDMILLDFSKAFDKVPHNRLLTQVESLWYSGTNLILDQSFPDRTHSICGSWRSEVWGSPSDIWCPSRNSPRTYSIPSIHQWPPPASLIINHKIICRRLHCISWNW